MNLYHDIYNNTAVYGCGHEQYDRMLKGGFYTNEFTEVSGPVGGGKSQLCLCFMANLIANSDGRVLFVDTTGSFSALRIAEILLAKYSVVEMKEVGNLLRRAVYEKSNDRRQLDEILDSICANVNDIRNNLKAVVVDHVSTVLSPTLVQERMQGMQNMMRTAVRLRDLAKRYNLCVVVVNNATETENGELEPSLGPWWTSIPDTRLLVRPVDDNLFSAQLLRSVRADCGNSVTFSIGAQGLLSPCSGC
ncbi:dna repair protein rad51 [Trichuris trichiura]|uniref:Dna repair protein rad51 n=1 Tax=Trichuris trichiura TaxID=36087 RepID=A0A077Z1E0_TRITR|nr:dna repair protein rad51 [Trichuris trichiura]